MANSNSLAGRGSDTSFARSSLASTPQPATAAATMPADCRQGSSAIPRLLQKRAELELADLPRDEKAQTMADWGESFLTSISEYLSADLFRELEFALAKAVITLEQFKHHEYRRVDRLSFETHTLLNKRYQHLSGFVKWAESYVDNRAPFATAVFDNTPKPLPLELMRDLISHNCAPVVMKLHDSRHIHFSIGHPEGPALFYMSARSGNFSRFSLLSALFETIDKPEFLYPCERTIRDYFRKAGFKSVQEAMIFVGKCGPTKINGMIAEMGLANELELEELKEWRPARTVDCTESDIVLRLNREIDDFVDDQRKYRNDKKTLERYYNYRQDLTAPSDAPIKDDDYIR